MGKLLEVFPALAGLTHIGTLPTEREEELQSRAGVFEKGTKSGTGGFESLGSVIKN